MKLERKLIFNNVNINIKNVNINTLTNDPEIYRFTADGKTIIFTALLDTTYDTINFENKRIKNLSKSDIKIICEFALIISENVLPIALEIYRFFTNKGYKYKYESDNLSCSWALFFNNKRISIWYISQDRRRITEENRYPNLYVLDYSDPNLYDFLNKIDEKVKTQGVATIVLYDPCS